MPRLYRIILVSTLLSLGAVSLAYADQLGQTVTFHTDSTFDAQGATTLTATLHTISSHAYFYVDDRYWAMLTGGERHQVDDALGQLANQFDTVIYPRATAFWGSERTPGIDGDPRVTLLFEQLRSGNGGYFRGTDNYPPSQLPESNGREMIYISAESILDSFAQSYMAHEFQHLISFNQKELLQQVADDTWLNEARSEYDITVVGYNDPYTGSTLQRRVFSFLNAPSDSLVEWLNTANDYSSATLFSHYLVGQLGPEIMQYTIHTPQAGVAALQGWLTQHPTETFPDLFSDWMVASSLNDRTLDPRFGYAQPDLGSIHVSPQLTIKVDGVTPTETALTIKEWQPVWIRFDVAPGIALPTLAFQVAGQTGPTWSGAYIAQYTNGRRVVTSFTSPSGQITLNVPMHDTSAQLFSVMFTVTQGTLTAVGNRAIQPLPVTITASTVATVVSPLKDGDLIRNDSQPEVYVIWGPYRRYLRNDVLALYGFQDRPVVPVTGDVFDRYTTSNYIRSINGYKVYAVWPDGTKHWLNITAAQWDASGRDWNAIFIVNDAEVNFYTTGIDITR